jgi:hypothetical protein
VKAKPVTRETQVAVASARGSDVVGAGCTFCSMARLKQSSSSSSTCSSPCSDHALDVSSVSSSVSVTASVVTSVSVSIRSHCLSVPHRPMFVSCAAKRVDAQRPFRFAGLEPEPLCVRRLGSRCECEQMACGRYSQTSWPQAKRAAKHEGVRGAHSVLVQQRIVCVRVRVGVCVLCCHLLVHEPQKRLTRCRGNLVVLLEKRVGSRLKPFCSDRLVVLEQDVMCPIWLCLLGEALVVDGDGRGTL